MAHTISHLRSFHVLGQRATQRAPVARGNRYRQGLRQLAEDEGYDLSYLYHAIRFAALYERDELHQLAGLTINHVRQLVLIKSAKQRRQLTQAALKHGWSVRQLRDTRLRVASAPRSQRRGGRPVRRPASTAEALHQVAEQAHRWLHRARPTLTRIDAGQPPPMPPAIVRHLRACQKAMQALVEAIDGKDTAP